MTQFVERSRQVGKTLAASEEIARRSGLPASVCADLLTRRWTYMEFIDKPSQWVAPSPEKIEPLVGLSLSA